MFENKSCFTHQTAMKSTTTSLVPALVISDWKCPSFSITMTFPVAVAILSKERVLWPRRTESKRITIRLKPLIIIIVDHGDVDKNMSSSSVVPVVLWGSTPPAHCISCIITTYDQKTVVTGSTDGQLGIWDLRFADDGEIKVSLRGLGFTLAAI